MNKKGFTLVELLMVVIIIGILVTLAVPNYYRSVERAKAGKAKAALDAIRKAELQYRAFNDTYTGTLTDLADYDLPTELQSTSDGDWDYTVSVVSDSEMDMQASRSQGPNSNSTLLMDEDGNLANPAAVGEWGVTAAALP